MEVLLTIVLWEKDALLETVCRYSNKVLKETMTYLLVWQFKDEVIDI